MTLTSPFHAYVIDKSQMIQFGRKVFLPEPVLIFGSYVNNTGIKFIFETEGRVMETEAQHILYDRPYGEPKKKVLIKLSKSNDYVCMTKNEAISKGIIEGEIEDEEADESEPSSDEGQKPKRTVPKRGKRQ